MQGHSRSLRGKKLPNYDNFYNNFRLFCTVLRLISNTRFNSAVHGLFSSCGTLDWFRCSKAHMLNAKRECNNFHFLKSFGNDSTGV